MTQRGYSDKAPLPLTGGGNSATQPSAPVNGNLAVQASLLEIFDEFTEVISGELKSMKMEDSIPDGKPVPGQPNP